MARGNRGIYRLAATLRDINRLKISKALKNKIRSTWLKTFYFNVYDAGNRIADITGSRVRFLDYEDLSYLFNEIFLNNEYYFASGKDDPYIIDCGSNIGMSVLYFKMLYPNSSILAFEPGQEAYNCLEENIKNNRWNSVVAHKTALSNKEGSVDYYYDPDNVGSLVMSLKQSRMPKQKRSVEASLLSKHIDKEVDFLKIDIEGAEVNVVEELSVSGKLSYVKQMAIEYHHHILKEPDIFSRMLKLLEDAGFGYQLGSRLERPFMRGQYQDILVYAYQSKEITDETH
ncbi:MAG: FkbM family methyltransferase [Candidatus Omnitrophota bacterium]